MLTEKIRPRKSLGQNFLQDQNIVRKIIGALHLSAVDHVLEIGPGQGALTRLILPAAALVVAVEIDARMVQLLHEQFSNWPNFVLRQEDVLRSDFQHLLAAAARWKVVANLPYHITSPVIFKLMAHRNSIVSATLMVQREVAERIVAGPGSKAYGILSVLSQYHADVKWLFPVSRHVFVPRPKVDSAVIQYHFRPETRLDEDGEALFQQIVKTTFNKRRKMLRHSLRSMPQIKIDLNQVDFDLELRPEQLSVDGFIELSRQIRKQLA
ncbi:MAG: 16S rRNA (adenine(1518)-N(6)/adenine(1519)-N(6))-dimethyltransferase RsmA [candidate division KSB1 bacterium]|nr:16S rRNA (adenine(1518)-N(6)/adenine(1519)-N(6))-dimethyltransferase RsmA [candidate division KSB1 bacterium]MDZ7319131.1 16S rRNA (adenine(1518)-N(6)/adenine(1519)-N(6))-dimethyltransferase RsmA [candidate division KSB1 bacterium]MDZ7341794.1 16S rRNA (adenine(1518)-N(6)/adenine(1519)-N(6))-dimethyltransferase RsmA [candidate division KSB1 bacterium]